MTREGKPDLTAKVPRTADGKPDLSGVWQIEPPAEGEIERLYGKGIFGAEADDPRSQSRYFVNFFIDYKPGEEPVHPEAAAQARKNGAVMDSPISHCLPYSVTNRYFNARPFKIFQTRSALLFFHEIDGTFRQIHTDGRKLPEDPFPAWLGYSTGHWEGDTMVVNSAGYNDKTWLDARGHIHSEEMRVEERFHRRDFGHLDIEMTVDDPKTLTKPVTIKFTDLLLPNTDVLESFCVEGERDRAFMPSARP